MIWSTRLFFAVRQTWELIEMTVTSALQPNGTTVEHLGHVGPMLRIKPSRGWVSLRLGELWEYRELLYFLAWRDVKVRYMQTGLGVAWAVLQPLLGMLVFTIFLGHLAKVGPTVSLTRSLVTRRCWHGSCSRIRLLSPATA